MQHAMQSIRESGSRPMAKAAIPSEGTDARMQGNMLANEALAYCQTSTQTWRSYAVRLIQGTVDMRAAFIAAIKAALKEMREENAKAGAAFDSKGNRDVSKNDSKQAAARVNSATVQINKLERVASAFNAAATVQGLCEYAGASMRTTGVTLDDCGFEIIVEYARTFSDSKAGRKADPWLVKLNKWLEKNTPASDDKEGLEQYKAIVALYNKLAA